MTPLSSIGLAVASDPTNPITIKKRLAASAQAAIAPQIDESGPESESESK